MGDGKQSLDDVIGMEEDPAEADRLRNDRLLGAAAILLHQRGHTDASNLLVDAASFELDYQHEDWGVDYFEAIIDVEPHLVERFSEEIQSRILETLREATERERFGISGLRVRALLPEVSPDWRAQLRSTQGPQPSNQARRVRLEPRHPVEDGLHFTNEWEHRVFLVLKEHQGKLEDNDTIGIVPLCGLKVRDHVFEPDFLVTYRGFVGVIEVDGPHHNGRRSNDKSRERLLRHAGVKYIDRLDVRDTTAKSEVEKFVTDFLRQLSA
ncbi:hypothetical protein ACFXDP_22590 [Streptomyces sp. NPDC059374]|uniref:hypothetical protein n=1 Tax=Streptomyces sp. NPDC059374 TaxID=3346814 RepID=UPI0036B08190